MGSQQMLAAQRVALYRRVEAMNDPEIFSLIEESHRREMNEECALEVHREWAADARLLVPPKPDDRCDCDVCAISRALRVLSDPLKKDS